MGVLAKVRAAIGDRGSNERAIVTLDDALAALGENGVLGHGYRHVPVADIVGTAARPQDFDIEFRPLNPALRQRCERLERAVRDGARLPPVELTQLGQMYFVRDGHHRVSIARSMGWATIDANVRQICTIAFGEACLRLAHLPSKAAERLFLQRMPLPDEVRARLWLERPKDWTRLGDAAESWAYRQLSDGRRFEGKEAIAAAWWDEEVTPVLEALRPAHPVGRDVQLYAAALAVRDRIGQVEWPDRNKLVQLFQANHAVQG